LGQRGSSFWCRLAEGEWRGGGKPEHEGAERQDCKTFHRGRWSQERSSAHQPSGSVSRTSAVAALDTISVRNEYSGRAQQAPSAQRVLVRKETCQNPSPMKTIAMVEVGGLPNYANDPHQRQTEFPNKAERKGEATATPRLWPDRISSNNLAQ
jgi:hypothetical protein